MLGDSDQKCTMFDICPFNIVHVNTLETTPEWLITQLSIREIRGDPSTCCPLDGGKMLHDSEFDVWGIFLFFFFFNRKLIKTLTKVGKETWK